MVKVKPCQPTIGKVRLVLKDVFKLSRVIGTFPIDFQYSNISKINLAKGLVLYFLTVVVAIVPLYFLTLENVSLRIKVPEIIRMIPIFILHWTHLSHLVLKRSLLKGVYDELKDIEYQFWKMDINWFHKPSWCTKYLSFAVMTVCGIGWEVLYPRPNVLFRLPNHITYISLFSITSQYLALLQICLSMLRQVRAVEESGTIVKLTDKLLALCHDVNALYEPQLLLYIVNIFVIILAVVYQGVIKNMTNTIDKHIWKMAFVYPLGLITLHVGYISQE
ncbi:Gustatory receptor 118a, partial [Halyomorpha halys]